MSYQEEPQDEPSFEETPEYYMAEINRLSSDIYLMFADSDADESEPMLQISEELQSIADEYEKKKLLLETL